MADVILPACTNFERDDLGECAACGGYTTNAHTGNNYRVIVREKKCIEPLWESRSDYQILAAIAERLGLDDEFTDGGKTELDWCQVVLRLLRPAKTLDWETFDGRATTSSTRPENYEPTPCLRWFDEGRACDTPDVNNPKRNTEKAHELGTYSGKIEFASESLKSFAPDDEERPVMPRYIPSWEGHHTTELFEKYPLQLMSPHPRFSFHCHYDKHTDWLDDIPIHRIQKDGYAWWPVRTSARRTPTSAVIRNGDIVQHVQRPRLRALLRGRHRARQARHRAQLRVVRQVRPDRAGQARFVDQGGCVEHPHAVPDALQERTGHDAQLVSHRSREVGGLIRCASVC